MLKPECYLSSENNASLSLDKTVSYSDKLNSLTAAFGSSKKRKAMQTKLKNKLDVETLETAVGNAIVESKKIAALKPVAEENNNVDENNESKLNDNFSIMPPQNKDAKTPNEVYQLNEVLSIEPSEFERFTLELSRKFAIATNESIKTWKSSSVYPEYVCEFLSKLINSKSKKKNHLTSVKLTIFCNFIDIVLKATRCIA